MTGAGLGAGRGGVPRGILVLGLLAAALRLALLHAPTLWYDEATVGIAGLAVLRGELPVYFFGQPFMGALGDAYLAAPLYVLFGVSGRTLEGLGVALGLLWWALAVRLAWEGFGARAAGFTALLLALPPNYLLHWSHEGRPHYLLAMGLGTLALWLGLRAPTAGPRRGLLRFALLGAVLGLAFWTNFLSVVFVPAVAVLAVRRGWRPPLRGAVAAVPAFLLGSLPHWLYAVPRGLARPPLGGPIPWTDAATHLRWAAERSWPALAGVPPDLGSGAPWLAGLVGAVYAGLVLAGVLAVRRAGPAAPAVALASLVLAATNLGLTVGTPYGRFLENDPRYLLPLYTALPPLLGLGLARLPRAAAAAGAAGLLLVQAGGALAGDLRVLTPSGAGPARSFYRAQLETVAALERAGLTRLYTADFGARVFTFLSGERVIFSEHYREIHPRYALAVDGADAVAWWAGRWPAFEQNLRALGVEAVYQPLPPLGGAYTRFTLRVAPLREVDPHRLRVTASEAAERAVWTADRDLGTLWQTAAPKRGGEWLEVDLGAVEPVVLLRLLPGTYQEVPTGLRLEASADGIRWSRLLEVPEYLGPLYWSAGRPMARVRGGRVELRVPPTPARYLRLTQLGQDARWPWTVRELFVYAQAPGAPPPPPDVDGDALAAAVRSAGVRRLYADHGWGSRVALREPSVRVLPANLAVDPYGFTGPARAFWPRVRWAPGSGVLLEPADAEAFERRARAHGWGFTRAPAAGLVLFAYVPPSARPGVALPRGAFRVTASREAAHAARAADGDPATRWGTGRPQAPGDWVRIDLDGPRVVRAVRLWTAHPTDAPRELAVEGAGEGGDWRPLAARVSLEGRVRWGGMTALRDGVEAVRLDFAPARLAALRLTLTRGDPVFDWSIHELTVYGLE